MMARERSIVRRSSLALLVAALAAATWQGASAQDAPSTTPTPAESPASRQPTSSWKGAIHLPGEGPLEIIVHFDVPIPGQATMDIPAQGMSREPLSALERGEGFIRFRLDTAGRPAGAAEFELAIVEPGIAAGTMKQYGQTFKVTLARIGGADAAAVEAVAPPRPQTPEEPFLYTIRPVSFTSAGADTRIAGTLTIPGRPPAGSVYDHVRHPVVIIIGGAEPRDRDGTIEGHKPFWVLADHLAMKGIAALRMDDRGVGASTGDKRAASLKDLVADVRAAIGILRVQPDIDSTRVILIGFDEGATIAARAGAELRDVSATILITTRLTPAEALPNVPAEEIQPASQTTTRPALNLRGGGEHRATYWDQHDNDSDHALMKREGAAPVEVRVLENLNAALQTLAWGGDPSNVGAIEETTAPAALEVITSWLEVRFKR